MDINTELVARKHQQNRIKALQREIEELEKDLRETQFRVRTYLILISFILQNRYKFVVIFAGKQRME